MTHSITPPSNKGFTLIELAIALMVIGLLIGGVLKGQELIQNARITRVIKDVNDYDTAVLIFRNTYNALPSDLRNPNRIPNCTTTECLNTSYTVGNNLINTHAKSANFWRQLHAAGMISSINENSAASNSNMAGISPTNTFDAPTSIYQAPAEPTGVSQNRFFFFDRGVTTAFEDGMRVKNAIAIDTKIDDGKPYSGAVQAHRPGTPVWSGSACVQGATTDYPTNQSQSCSISILTGSINP